MQTRAPSPNRLVAVVALLGLLAVAAACGHRTSTEELVSANSEVTEREVRGGSSGDGPDDVGVDIPGDAGSGPVDGGAGGGSTGGASGGSTGGPTGGGGGGGTGGIAVATCPGTPGETGPIVIGSVGNYSGIAGPPQAPMARAVQIWAEWVNSEGGLCGRRVQVVVVDDRGDPAQHVAALRDLVENRKVVAFVVNAGALTIASGKQYLESAGVPVIGTACANTTEYESPVMFPQCSHVIDFYERTIQIGVQSTGQRDFGFFSCSEAQTCTDGLNNIINGGAAERAGANVKYNGRGSLAQPDFTSECQSARNSGVQLMQVLLDPTGVIRFGQSCARQGYRPVFLQGSATAFYNTKDQPGFERLIVAGQVFNFIGEETPARRQFHDVMDAFYGRPPGPGEAYGWAAAKLFEHVATIAAAHARSITPQTLMDALHTLEGETLGGLTVPLTFPAGGAARPAECAFGAQVVDGEWQPLNGGEPFCG